MVNKSGRIGTAGETGVTRYLAANGFPNAERRRLKGMLDQGDLITVPGVCVEVKSGEAAKAASLRLLGDWLGETERERVNAAADVAVLVVQRRGCSPARAQYWRALFPAWAWAQLHGVPAAAAAAPHAPIEVTLETAVAQLRAAGYGDPLPVAEVA
jgi:hypothetical protein